ncbi:MAG: hypothetical protein QXU06_00430 [Candidatus Bathyarchaeia archaeon]
MPRIKDAEEIRREISAKYDKDPKRWQVFVSRDPKGFYGFIVVKGDEMWLTKEEVISPYKTVGLGVKDKMESPSPLSEISPFPFGFRPLSQDRMEEIMELVDKGGPIDGLMAKIMRSEPKPIRAIKTPIVLQGPVIHLPKPGEILSERQRRLDAKLREGLEKLLYRKYGQTVLPYM